MIDLNYANYQWPKLFEIKFSDFFCFSYKSADAVFLVNKIWNK